MLDHHINHSNEKKGKKALQRFEHTLSSALGILQIELATVQCKLLARLKDASCILVIMVPGGDENKGVGGAGW